MSLTGEHAKMAEHVKAWRRDCRAEPDQQIVGGKYQRGRVLPVAVYDPETHEESAIIFVPCPALEVLSQDETGNTYFSPWTYGPALSLFGEGPTPCIRRIAPDGQLDEAWTPDLSTWTEGRPVHKARFTVPGVVNNWVRL